MEKWFALASGLVALVGAPPYLYDILKRRTKPERTSWFIWTVQGSIAFGSQVMLGAHWSLVFVGLNAAGNLAVWLLSLRFGVGGWRKIDIWALVIAAIGVAASLIVRDPLLALLGVIVGDFAGVVPTLYKTFRAPQSETAITWFMLGTSSLLAIFSVGSWSFSLLLYPVYLALANYAVNFAQLLARLRHHTAMTASTGR